MEEALGRGDPPVWVDSSTSGGGSHSVGERWKGSQAAGSGWHTSPPSVGHRELNPGYYTRVPLVLEGSQLVRYKRTPDLSKFVFLEKRQRKLVCPSSRAPFLGGGLATDPTWMREPGIEPGPNPQSKDCGFESHHG